MPCDQIRLMEIDLDAADRDILKAALKDVLKWTFTEQRGIIYARTRDGIPVTIHPDHVEMQRGREKLADQIKQAYSMMMVKVGQEKFGFQLAVQPDGVIEISKESFEIQTQLGGGGFQIQSQFGA